MRFLPPAALLLATLTFVSLAADCAVQVQVTAILTDKFKANPADAFALFRTSQAVGAAVCFYITNSPHLATMVQKGSYVSTPDQLGLEMTIVAASLALGLLGYALSTCVDAK